MSVDIDREGIFKAEITDFGLKQMESGAVGISVRVALTDIWTRDTETWENWRDFDMIASGDIWVIKKDGQINQGAADSLLRHAEWDGNLESVANQTWKPTPVQVTIKSETYKDQTTFKVAFVNAYDRTPGAIGNVDEAKAKELQARFGSQFRALAGNAKRSSISVPGRPPEPPRQPATANSVPTAGLAPDQGFGEIPF